MNDSPKVPKVFEAIQYVQRRFSETGLAKSRNNTQQGFKFRGIDDVYNMLSTFLVEAKLLIMPRVVSRDTEVRVSKSGTALVYTNVTVDYEFISSEDGSSVTARMVGEAMDSGDKSSNKAMSAAYKYLCLQTFCIPTEGDNDADATTHELGREEPEQQPDRPARPGPSMTKAAHLKAIKAAQDLRELQSAFGKAWRDHGDPMNPGGDANQNQQAFKEAYDKRRGEIEAAEKHQPASVPDDYEHDSDTEMRDE